MRGERLKQIRTRRGISQRELAEVSEIAMRQIIRYEQNESEPNSSQLIKLCVALSISSDYLLGLTDEEEEHFKGEPLEGLQNEVIALLRKNTIGGLAEAIALLSRQISDPANREYSGARIVAVNAGGNTYDLVAPDGSARHHDTGKATEKTKELESLLREQYRSENVEK